MELGRPRSIDRLGACPLLALLHNRPDKGMVLIGPSRLDELCA
jgi:hypothetical protein